jgi:hypothetical protein
MDISNGSGGIDSSKLMDYFTKDFLTDLGKMAVLRDELEKRQGSMNAVDAANKKLADANTYAESRKAEVDALLVDTKAKNADSKTKQATLDAREKDLESLEKQAADASDANAKAAASKDAALASRDAALAKNEAALAIAQATLATDRANLDARVKALQDKVASINI